MPSKPGHEPVSLAFPATGPAAAAVPRWSRCHFLTSGLPTAKTAELQPCWPAELLPPFDTPVATGLATRPALAQPDELRSLGISVVPCLVLEGGRPPVTVPVPEGTSWPRACHTLMARAARATQPDGLRSTADELPRSIAHDLRGPLVAAARLIEMALEGPEVGAADRQALQQAGRSVLMSAQRLEALRQYLHLDRGPMVRQRVDAGAMVLSLAAELDVVWPHQSRHVRVAPALYVHADREQLQLALRQLLDNAFKFSQRAETAEITVALHHVPGFTVLEMADNGPGFSAAHAGTLFGLFQRVHLVSEFPGLGAGLALVRRMAERHGGWAWADLGTPGVTAFLLALPEGESHDG